MNQARIVFDFDHLKLIAQLRMGPDTMFVWDSMTKNGTQRNALYVGLDKHNQLRLSAVSSSTPVEVLVLNSFEAAQADSAYRPSPNIRLRYEYPIPLAARLTQRTRFFSNLMAHRWTSRSEIRRSNLLIPCWLFFAARPWHTRTATMIYMPAALLREARPV